VSPTPNFFGAQWDHDNPTNASRWQTQHNGLRDLAPPYVYNVFSGDTQGFVQAVKYAIANPIDRWVEQAMTESDSDMNCFAATSSLEWPCLPSRDELLHFSKRIGNMKQNYFSNVIYLSSLDVKAQILSLSTSLSLLISPFLYMLIWVCIDDLVPCSRCLFLLYTIIFVVSDAHTFTAGRPFFIRSKRRN
jgi:hypothetical protein